MGVGEYMQKKQKKIKVNKDIIERAIRDVLGYKYIYSARFENFCDDHDVSYSTYGLWNRTGWPEPELKALAYDCECRVEDFV